MKSVQIWSFFWSESRKKRTRKNSAFGHFSSSVLLSNIVKKIQKNANTDHMISVTSSALQLIFKIIDYTGKIYFSCERLVNVRQVCIYKLNVCHFLCFFQLMKCWPRLPKIMKFISLDVFRCFFPLKTKVLKSYEISASEIPVTI